MLCLVDYNGFPWPATENRRLNTRDNILRRYVFRCNRMFQSVKKYLSVSSKGREEIFVTQFSSVLWRFVLVRWSRVSFDSGCAWCLAVFSVRSVYKQYSLLESCRYKCTRCWKKWRRSFLWRRADSWNVSFLIFDPINLFYEKFSWISSHEN